MTELGKEPAWDRLGSSYVPRWQPDSGCWAASGCALDVRVTPKLGASLAVVPEDVRREISQFRGWTVMAIRMRGNDRSPRVEFHGELQAPSGFDSLVTVGISLDGPIAIWSSKDGEAGLHAGFVADCYALNVGPGEVLACPYDDFPVVRIEDRQVRVIPTSGVSGTAGIIAGGDQVGLIGTYGDPSLLITGAIQDGAFRESERANLWAPDGAPLPKAQVHCRGSIAHFFAGGKWYSFDLESVV